MARTGRPALYPLCLPAVPRGLISSWHSLHCHRALPVTGRKHQGIETPQEQPSNNGCHRLVYTGANSFPSGVTREASSTLGLSSTARRGSWLDHSFDGSLRPGSLLCWPAFTPHRSSLHSNACPLFQPLSFSLSLLFPSSLLLFYKLLGTCTILPD